MERVSDYAVLNANYIMKRLQSAGFDLAFPQRRASHEFIVTLKRQAKENDVNAMDVAKALLDREIHAPTTYFPLLVPECLLIEPTETESKETLDRFVMVMAEILNDIEDNGQRCKDAPTTTPVRRLDDVRAARQLDVRYQPPSSDDGAQIVDAAEIQAS
jgi:glycine dehydrogenase subunit 2